MKFSIRDALALTAIVGLSLGWCVDRTAVARRANRWEHRAQEMVRIANMFRWNVIWKGDNAELSTPAYIYLAEDSVSHDLLPLKALRDEIFVVPSEVIRLGDDESTVRCP
jgi:hypothetical protein